MNTFRPAGRSAHESRKQPPSFNEGGNQDSTEIKARRATHNAYGSQFFIRETDRVIQVCFGGKKEIDGPKSRPP
jgi:hypothetical protein